MHTSFLARRGLLSFLAASVVLSVASARAQQNPQAPQALDDKGFVEGVSGNTLNVKLNRGDLWVITVQPNTKVTVTGTAESDYLRSGLFVKFTGELTNKGTALAKEIEQLEILIPPGKGGAFDPSELEKPVRSPEDGKTYELRGRIASYKPGELTVTIGSKKLAAKTSPTIALTISSDDVGLAQQGDTLSLKAWYSQQQKPNVAQMQPGYAMAELVAITLTKPLAGTKKKLPALKGPRGKAPVVPEVPALPANPFSK